MIPCADVLEPGSPGTDILDVAVPERTGPDEVRRVFSVGFMVMRVGLSDTELDVVGDGTDVEGRLLEMSW